jgi:hypothetical protein
MGEIKTHRTNTDVGEFIAEIADEARRSDCLVLLDVARATGESPSVWSSGVVGFGTFHYQSASGQEGDWFPVGFASRKAAITVYLGLGLEEFSESLGRLGTHKTGRGCLYLKRLSDIDLAVFEVLVADAYASIGRTYG